MDPKHRRLLLAVIIPVLILVIGGLIGFAVMNRTLKKIPRAEYEQKGLTDEGLSYWATYNPDAEHQAPIPSDDPESAEPIVETTVETEPVFQGDYLKNVLIIGQAYRYGEDTKLADSIILATIDPKTKTVTLTSFLRDMYIQLPTFAGRMCGKNRINVIYNLGWRWAGEYGGMEMMDKCLLESFGVNVDHNIEIGFETFYEIVDTIGGIDLELTQEEVDCLKQDKTGMNDNLHPGMNHMIGYTALCYARMRKIDSDKDRTNRQRKVIGAIVDQCRDLDVGELKKLIDRVVPMVITDMSDREIRELTAMLIPMLPDLKIETATCPAEGTYWGQTIDIAGYLSDVLCFHVEPNREILEQRCEIPAETQPLTEPAETGEETTEAAPIPSVSQP